MIRSLACYHRLSQPALLPKPMISARPQIVDRMLAKKFRRQPFRRRFVGDGLRAILAELSDLTIAIRAWPGAALAIKPCFLVGVEQGFEAARNPHLANSKARGLDHSGKTGGNAGGFG